MSRKCFIVAVAATLVLQNVGAGANSGDHAGGNARGRPGARRSRLGIERPHHGHAPAEACESCASRACGLRTTARLPDAWTSARSAEGAPNRRFAGQANRRSPGVGRARGLRARFNTGPTTRSSTSGERTPWKEARVRRCGPRLRRNPETASSLKGSSRNQKVHATERSRNRDEENRG